MFLRARYLEPAVGRFLSRDVWEGDPNQPMSYNAWLYVGANPTNLTDFSGMYWTDSQCESLPNFQAREFCRLRRMENWQSRFDEPPYIHWLPNVGLMLLPDLASNSIGAQLDFQAAGREWNSECGQLAIGAVLGLTAKTVVTEFDRWARGGGVEGWAGDQATSGEWLRDFVNARYSRAWEAHLSSTWYDPRRSSPEWIRERLADNSFVIPLVRIQHRGRDPVEGGRVDIGGDDPTSHWVVITALSAEWRSFDDDSAYNWVRVFNPFNNATEYYRWVVTHRAGVPTGFREAWHSASGVYESVVIRRKGIGEVPPRAIEVNP